MPFGASRAGLMSTRVDAIPDSVVLLPQADDLEHFTGETDAFDINDSDGIITEFNELSLEINGAEGDQIESVSGLNKYPQQGDTFSWFIQLPSGEGRQIIEVLFGLQDNSNWYAGQLDSDGFIRLRKDGSTESSSDSSVPLDEWLEFEIEWANDGEITGSLFSLDSTDRDTELASASFNDTDYESGGIGVNLGRDADGSRIDFIDVLSD